MGEYEKYQELQARSQRLQEVRIWLEYWMYYDSADFLLKDYERRISEMEEAREKALQELTEYYEAKIKEKNRELKEASDEHDQQQRKMEEIQKQTEEDTDHEILTLKNTYERDLKKQIDSNMKLRGELGIKTKKVWY